MPILTWLPRYDRRDLRTDIVAGIAIWALVIPQHIAYAQIAGLPPQAGVFVSILAPLVYAIFGTSRQLLCGPSSSTAIISAVHVGALADGDVRRFATLSAALAVMAGTIFIVMGVFRLGFISQFISSAVQIGFLFGLGLTIAVGQVFEMLGISGGNGPFYKQFWYLLQHLNGTNWWTLGLGVACFAIVWGLQHRWPAVPSALVVVVLAILAVTFLDLKQHGVAVIGDIDGRLPRLDVPLVSGETMLQLLPAAIAIVMVCYTESITIARRYADKHHYQIRPDQELIAQGAASLACGLFQGFVVSGGASQSAANDRNGARTQVTALVLAGMAALTAVALMPLLSNLPFAVLGAVVVNSVLGFFDVAGVRRLFRIRRTSFGLGFVTFLGVIFGGILAGLLIGVAASIILLLILSARPRVTALAPVAGTDAFVPVTALGSSPLAGLTIVRPDAPLLYLNATSVLDTINAQLAAMPAPPRVLVVDLEESTAVDITVLDTFRSLKQELDAMQVDLWWSNVHPDVERVMRLDDERGDGHLSIFATNAEAVARYADQEETPA